MHCPPEIAKILAGILSTGLLRIRAMGSGRWDANRCAIEADHLHNLPALLTEFKPELLEYYWRVERPSFVKQSSPDDTACFEPLWIALADHIGTRTAEAASVR